MKAKILMIGAVALAFASGFASAAPGGNGSTSTGSTTGVGYNHMNSGNAFGQPNQSCQDINGGNTGPSYPGETTTARGSAFNETNGIAGSVYAGNVPQSQRNTASVSQYDVACEMQPM
jgi:hypothetical protein